MTTISNLISFSLIAQTAEPVQSAWPNFLLFGIIILIFYFLVLGPQKKEAQVRQEMRESLKKGDDVVTDSGMYGQVSDVDGAKVTLRVGQKSDVVFIVFDKTAIGRVLKKADKSEASEAKK